MGEMMTKEIFLLKLEELLQLPSHTLNGSETVKDPTLFDSLIILDLAFMAEKEFGVHITIVEILASDTLDDLYLKIVSKNQGK